MLKLNLGCGNNYMDGYINVDKYATNIADMVYDLEELPWTWADNSVSEVILKHVLEHLGQSTQLYLNIIKELYRVCAPGALITIDVPHPLHTDYLGDPTHCRPITAEGLWLFNQGYCDDLINSNSPGTPLAKYLGVDFVMEEHTTFPDNNGNIRASRFVLKVRKPIKLALMSNGLGDVVMGLGAAHALHDAGYRVSITAQERYHEIIRLCPYVYSVSETNRENEIWTCAWNYLQPRHQIDEYLSMCGLDLTTVSNKSKSVDLLVSPTVINNMALKYPGKNRIIIHTACSSNSRKWPKEYWQSLVDRFVLAGIEVISIGKNTYPWAGFSGVDTLVGVVEEFNTSIEESIALLNQCKLLISSDSSPIHLAGATECGILGLFSVMSPEFRLPFRHGELGWNAFGITTPCKYSPCYPNMVENHDFVWSKKAIDILINNNSMADLIENFCENKEDYQGCMKAITVGEVYNKAVEMYNKKV